MIRDVSRRGDRSISVSTDIDSLVPDPTVAKEFHTTLMTLWRWDHDPAKAALGWPPKVKIGARNYRHRSALESFKANLLQRALAEREAAA
jgi:hypothetical protein